MQLLTSGDVSLIRARGATARCRFTLTHVLPNPIIPDSHEQAHVPKSVFGLLTNWVLERVPTASLVGGSYENGAGMWFGMEDSVSLANQSAGAIQPAPHAATGK